MLNKLWRKVFKGRAGKDTQPKAPIVLSRDQHPVSRQKISKNALKVLYRLNQAGFQAYLVGGGVRDILLGFSPKDFDIATDATPEQVGRLFRNSRLIGRRFRLAHILFGREVIEVATFRAGHEESEGTPKKLQSTSKVSEQGLLLRDNVYGSLEEDAIRRDFTVNALYYTVEGFLVKDFVGGFEDLEKKQLRLIGDPETRYTEDPVRILRAIRLAAKLDLTIESKTAAPIPKLADMLEHVSSARLWDEANKLFLGGHAYQTWQLLLEKKVADHLFEQTTKALKDHPEYAAFLASALKNTDKRIARSQPVTPAFLFAVLLWEPLKQVEQKALQRGLKPFEASEKAANQVLDKQRERIAIPKRFTIVMREIWSLQHRLGNRRKKNVDRLIQHPRFRAAYDFLCLRAGDDAELTSVANWWTEFQDADPETRFSMIKKIENGPGAKRKSGAKNKRRPRNKAPASKHS